MSSTAMQKTESYLNSLLHMEICAFLWLTSCFWQVCKLNVLAWSIALNLLMVLEIVDLMQKLKGFDALSERYTFLVGYTKGLKSRIKSLEGKL